jgi:cell division protein FtsW
MLYSAGIVDGQRKFDSSYYYLKHQLINGILPGMVAFFLAYKLGPKFWKKISLPLLFVTIGLMVLVLLPQFGVSVKGAQRWVQIGFVRFQPSEFLKLAIIIYLAAWFSQRGGQASAHWSYSVLPFLLVLGFAGGLLALQPDLKTLIIVTMLGLSIYFFAGAKLKHIFGFVLVVAVVFTLLAIFAPYRFDRIKTFINPKSDTQGISYHANQALMSVAKGGLFGVGYGQSQQKINALPEPAGDSIFAVIIEELGFVGGAAVIGLLFFLVFTLINIAKNTSDSFNKLLTLGMAVWISLQAFINMAAIIGIIPLTGVPLPFFSYGSSSLVALLAGLGIVKGIAQTR